MESAAHLGGLLAVMAYFRQDSLRLLSGATALKKRAAGDQRHDELTRAGELYPPS